MKIKKHVARGTTYVDFKKGRIESDREEGTKIWQEDGGRVYVTCFQCSTIADISDHQFTINGEVSPCVICDNCKTHYFPKLQGWDGSHSLVCAECGFVALFKSGDKETGWKKVRAGCSCCSMNACPKCAKGK